MSLRSFLYSLFRLGQNALKSVAGGLWRWLTDIIWLPKHLIIRNLSPYHYSPLTGPSLTRLVTVKPWCTLTSEPISISLKAVDLESLDGDGYVAISYAWNGQTPTEPIECDGGKLFITKTLLSALKRLRLPHKAVDLWVDALSINQDMSALQERSLQVGMMNKIFGKANSVLVYIDTEGWSSHVEGVQEIIRRYGGLPTSAWTALHQEASETLQSLEQNPPQVRVTSLDGTGPRLARMEEIFSRVNLLPFASFGWDQLTCFLLQPWFRRIWIIQEYALNNTVKFCIGDKNIPGDAVMTSIVTAHHHFDILERAWTQDCADYYSTRAPPHPPHLLSDLYQKRRHTIETCIREYVMMISIIRLQCHHDESTWDPAKLHANLMATENFGCKENKDRIYAIRGISADASDAELYVDYAEDECVLGERTASQIIRTGKLSELLLHYSTSTSGVDCGWRFCVLNSESRPHGRGYRPLYVHHGEGSVQFKASQDLVPDVPALIPVQGRCTGLVLRGLAGTQIRSLCPPLGSQVAEREDQIFLRGTDQPQLSVNLTFFQTLAEVWRWWSKGPTEPALDFYYHWTLEKWEWLHSLAASLVEKKPLETSILRAARLYNHMEYFHIITANGSTETLAIALNMLCYQALLLDRCVASDDLRKIVRLSQPSGEQQATRELMLECTLMELAAFKRKDPAFVHRINAHNALSYVFSHIIISAVRGMRGRRLCILEDGRVALVPELAVNGDTIAVLAGCSMLFVIRLVGDGTHHLIGPCYVHGIMDGEAVQDPDWTETSFVLRSGEALTIPQTCNPNGFNWSDGAESCPSS